MKFDNNTIKDFTLGKTLGTGSFGRVRFCTFTSSQEHFAMKQLKKSEIIRLKQVDHMMSEKAILKSMNHPFIVNMYGSFHDPRYLYLVLEYIVGGEFFTHLRRAGRFDNDTSRFYSSQIVSIFEYMHGKNIIYRDLKPENILLTASGYLKLTDFGFAKIIDYRTYTLCGTPEYIAPEVLLNKGHGKPVDWWTLGILIYEMVVGQPPFCDEEPMGIYQKILAGKIYFPKYFEKNAKALVKKILVADLGKRYGNLKDGANDILQSKWLSTINLSMLEQYQIPAPFKPPCKDDKDFSNFENVPDSKTSPPAVTG